MQVLKNQSDAIFIWSAKIKVALIHFLATLIVAAICGALVFGVWFPWPFYKMLGGTELFLLVTVSDLILGPLVSLVIYTPRKTKNILLRDYAVVTLVQVASLMYGMHTVALIRPIFVVYAVDGLEVVSAGDINDEDLVAAKTPWNVRSWTGPLYTWAPIPADIKEKNDLVFSALNGKDIQFQPRYFKPYVEGRKAMQLRSKSIEQLLLAHPDQATHIRQTIRDLAPLESNLAWLPVRNFEKIWTVIVDKRNMQPLAWLELDPY